jgi:hypothetical protein
MEMVRPDAPWASNSIITDGSKLSGLKSGFGGLSGGIALFKCGDLKSAIGEADAD